MGEQLAEDRPQVDEVLGTLVGHGSIVAVLDHVEHQGDGTDGGQQDHIDLHVQAPRPGPDRKVELSWSLQSTGGAPSSQGHHDP